MIFPHQPEQVYVVGAAGFWLHRFHTEERARQEKVKRLLSKLAKRNLREIRRKTRMIAESVGQA